MTTSIRIAAVIALVGAIVVLLTQVRVEHADADVSRTCGSAFDAMIDRSGWELWWSHDLAEPSPATRDALVRTHRCPEAVNQMMGIAAGLAALAGALGLFGKAPTRARTSDAARPDSLGAQLLRLGRLSSVIATVLLVAGIGALIVLVADADSTLFLYTDRLVVAVIGLIILVPIIALWVIGRLVALVAGAIDSLDSPESDG